MVPRPAWKGFLRLSLVTCPVALYPAAAENARISFNQINKKTGSRVKHLKTDADTGDEVAGDDIVKGFKVGPDSYVHVTPAELEAIAPESSRMIEIDSFVPTADVDPVYHLRSYFVAPSGKVGLDAYVVLREMLASSGKTALARVVLGNREQVIALQARGKGMLGTVLHFAYEVRDEADYFADVAKVRITQEMRDLALHLVKSKSKPFDPSKFEDRYETALAALIGEKRKGKPAKLPKARKASAETFDLMSALLKSVTPKLRKPVKVAKVPKTVKAAPKPAAKTALKGTTARRKPVVAAKTAKSSKSAVRAVARKPLRARSR